MNEHLLQLIASLKIIWVAIFSYLYGEGGISNKWIRRFVGGAWIGLGILGFSIWQGNFNYLKLMTSGLLTGALTLGYGADETIIKIEKRALYGMALAVAGLPLAICSSLWMLFAFNVIMCLMVSVLFGVWNPFKNARDEETAIASFSLILTMYLI